MPKPMNIYEAKTHLSRLRLKPFRDVKERSICFDMVFSSRPSFPPLLQGVEWQHMPPLPVLSTVILAAHKAQIAAHGFEPNPWKLTGNHCR